MSREDFSRLCEDFARNNAFLYTRIEPTLSLREAASGGDTVLVVTASMREWVRPWLDIHGLQQAQIIGTEMEVDADGLLTGRFATPN